jgi:hypothetical protein
MMIKSDLSLNSSDVDAELTVQGANLDYKSTDGIDSQSSSHLCWEMPEAVGNIHIYIGCR